MELKPIIPFKPLGNEELLIVPYGIETIRIHDRSPCTFAFNRTLWN